jgi:hypothetical protein
MQEGYEHQHSYCFLLHVATITEVVTTARFEVLTAVLLRSLYLRRCYLTLRQLMLYTGCPRRKGQKFGRVFLMLKYTDITQNTYIQS